jgi:cytochrome c
MSRVTRLVRPALLVPICLATLTARADDGGKVDVANGQAIFEQRCMICHAATTTPSGPAVGPHMVGIVGRKAAAAEDFPLYSAALKASGLTWDVRTLSEFLSMPTSKVPGTTMPMTIADAKERADVIGYLATLK